jgi:signal transduction histidine kinase
VDALTLGLAVALIGSLVVGAIAIRRGRRASDGWEELERRAGSDLVAIVTAVPLPALLVGTDGVVRQVNERVAELGLPLLPGVGVADVSATLSRALDGARGTSGVVERVHLGDPPRTWDVTLLELGTRVLVLFRDVTEAVDFEEARRTFSAAVSHELRTPLARVLGLAETLALPGEIDDREELVEQIEAEVDGMRRLIDEMLLLAALDRGRTAVGGGVADLADLAGRIVDEARTRRIGRGREIHFSADGALDVPVAPRLLEVVVRNLIDNALLHGGGDAVVDVVTRHGDQAAELEVRDTGRGITAEHLPYIFQRFYRGDAARSGPGSGLGLALVKHIVEAHDGAVVVESSPGAETRFVVRIPYPEGGSSALPSASKR